MGDVLLPGAYMMVWFSLDFRILPNRPWYPTAMGHGEKSQL